MPAACCRREKRCFRDHADAWLRGEEVDGPWSVAVLLDEAAVVLRTRGSMDGSPAVLAVIPEAVDIAAEVGSIAASAVHSVALVTHLVVQHIWLYLHL